MEAMDSKVAGEAGTPPRRSGGKAAVLPGYLRPAAGSCHHVCKYGGTHAFEEKEAHGSGRVTQPRSSRRQQQRPPAELESGRRTAALDKVRAASSRRRAGDFSKPETTKSSKAAVVDGGKARRKLQVATADTDAVEWKDIVAYDAVPAACGSSPRLVRIVAGDSKKKDVMKGKKPFDNGKVVTQQDVGAVNPDGLVKKKVVKYSVASKLTGKTSAQPDRSGAGSVAPPSEKKKKMIKSTKSAKPPKAKKDIAIERKAIGQEMIHGDAATAADDEVNGGKSLYPLDEEDQRAAAAAAAMDESGRPIAAAHRRVKSMSISNRSVQFPFTRQASKSSVTFKLRSKSGRAAPPEEEEKTAVPRLRLFRRGDASSRSGNGVQLRIRSLRRRGGGTGGGGAAGFVVPSVALRHQKTLEKKKSRKLYNSVIEETASKLVKARKSKVRALVGAFETLISKIGK